MSARIRFTTRCPSPPGFVFTLFMGQLGLEHNLYNYGSDAGRQYSDMNGFGPFVTPFVWFKLYWAAVAALLALLSNLLWVRGEERSTHWRMRLARARLSRRVAVAFVVAGGVVLGTGGFIFYNTNQLNEFRTTVADERVRAEYERLYKQYEGIPQPRVTGVELAVEIYPERRDVEIRGEMRLANRSGVMIDSVHVLLVPDVEVRSLVFDPPAELRLEDPRHGYHIFGLASPLAPGDSLVLRVDLAFVTAGFENSVSNLGVVENGTFINSSWLPSIGYAANAELASDNVRKKHGLQPKERAAPVADVAARMNNFISHDADWIDFRATIGTSPDQIALAPGYLRREWREGERRYFRYEMDSPILNFYSFLSARYAVKEDHWQDVPIQIYYHPGHEYNLERMIRSVKQSLDYYTANFGPYQHRQVRILEFPRYSTFAQSFPNTIPYSEGIGFIARIEDEDDDVDYPFYVTAHEVAHQWWGHQAVGGDVQGAAVISETLSQYSALMVMQQEFGPAQMKKFLKYELDQYLAGRSGEQKKEVPLLLAEGQGYIHYNKGSIAMYALQDYIGEERVNEALRSFLTTVRYQEPPYTNSIELLAYLRAVTADSLQYLLEDMFETITLHENRVVQARSSGQPDGAYVVRLEIETRKLRADSLGNETEIPMSDWVDIGVFGAREPGSSGEGKELYLRKHRLQGGATTLEIRVTEKPQRAGVDPYHKLIDRHTNDNVVTVREGG
jgi:ABC-2 type transport system permease protein